MFDDDLEKCYFCDMTTGVEDDGLESRYCCMCQLGPMCNSCAHFDYDAAYCIYCYEIREVPVGTL